MNTKDEKEEKTGELVAYCMKCKAKREMSDAEAVYTAIGQPGTRGVCSVCGTTMFKMGYTPAHDGVPKPEITPEQRKASRKKGQGKKRGRQSRIKRDGKLVIVESPAKARTVGRFLGKDYVVKASVGHVRDLLRSKMSVDTENDFEPRYRVPKEKREVVNELKDVVKRSAEVYLATDPDREGEAIAWHLMEAAGIDEEQARRVVFHEITKDAIEEAFSHPGEVNMDLVNAQQARRILDRLVGYSISPILWKNVRSRTSAGRVQSVALRLIVEREREIEAFVPDEYWSIEAELAKKPGPRTKKPRSFLAKLQRINDEKFELTNKEDTDRVVEELERSIYVVGEVRRGERKRNPSPPFTTSTMQQEASRKLGFTARRTMSIAQQLYEGIDLGGEQGTVGLITYMRTDSVNVAEQAQAEARDFILREYGEKFLPKTPPKYKTRAKSAQEAHEAVRPTSVMRQPEKLKTILSRDQFRLYRLIWQRFVASQMKEAVYATMSVDVLAGPKEQQERPYLFRASGSRIKFRGYMAVYEEAQDEDAAPDEETGRILPDMQKGEELDMLELFPNQHFTQPPPRYTEATLVRTLEEYGIGRPSTYAPIITTIQNRGYVERVDRRLQPTDIGTVINDLVVEHFPIITDYQFTARMEEDLDLIASNDREWVPVLREFYGPFKERVDLADKNMQKVDIADRPIGEDCPKCGKPLILKFGRYGLFIACSGFPDCRFTKSYHKKIGVKCPECGGELVERKTRRKRIFYGCENYVHEDPESCQFSTWKRPLIVPCPACEVGLLVEQNKQSAQCLNCEEQFPLEEIEAKAARLRKEQKEKQEQEEEEKEKQGETA